MFTCLKNLLNKAARIASRLSKRGSDTLRLGLNCGNTHLWKTRRFVTPACSRRWRTEATRSSSPPSRPTRLLSSRTRCHLWCSHLHRKRKKRKTRQGVTICQTIAGEPRSAASLLRPTGLSVGKNLPKIYRKKKTCLKLFPDGQTLL